MANTNRTTRALRVISASLLTCTGNHVIHWVLALLSATLPTTIAHLTGHNGPLSDTTGSLLTLLAVILLKALLHWLSRRIHPNPTPIRHHTAYLALTLLTLILWPLVPTAAAFTPGATTILTTAHTFLAGHNTLAWSANTIPPPPTTTASTWTIALLDTWLITTLTAIHTARRRSSVHAK